MIGVRTQSDVLSLLERELPQVTYWLLEHERSYLRWMRVDTDFGRQCAAYHHAFLMRTNRILDRLDGNTVLFR